MLRSVLYQFLLRAPELWDSYLHYFIKCQQKVQSDEWLNALGSANAGGVSKHPWSFKRPRKLFSSLGSIHAPGLHLTAYVIIDALDESEESNRQEIIELFRNASLRHPSWPITFKILLTSRPSPKIEQWLQYCPTIVLEDETEKDIIEYVNSETKRIATDILQCDHNEIHFISSYLIKWAKGVFLWVRLVLIELSDGATEGFSSPAELQALLLSIPPDLRQLYERILTKIQKGLPQTIRECQSVFRWVAYSPRPLYIKEMLEVVAASACAGSQISGTELKRRRVRNTEDMRRRLISLCGNLVEVKGGTVQFIHTSVREYLLEDVHDKKMSLARNESIFEIAVLSTNYVECFHGMIQQISHLSESEETPESSLVGDAATYADLIDELALLRFVFGREKEFLVALDHELHERVRRGSLRHAMIEACASMRPAMISTILEGKLDCLDRLILYPDQVNALYEVPLHAERFNQTLVDGSNCKHDYHATLLHMMSFLDTTWALDAVDRLHKHGANPDFQDHSG
jgi:hypothetical protein